MGRWNLPYTAPDRQGLLMESEDRNAVNKSLAIVGVLGLIVGGLYILLDKPCPPPLPQWQQTQQVGSPTPLEESDHHGISVAGSTARSPQWPTVRRHYLDSHPTCAACGATETEAALEVHHVRPFHVDPSLELDPSNLITLCRSGADHHLHVGHDPDGPDGPLPPSWKRENKNVRRDAAKMLMKHTPEPTR